MKVAVLGAAGGIGQALALLLKTQLPSGSELSLYDIAPVTPGVAVDLSHIPTAVKIKGFSGEDATPALVGDDTDTRFRAGFSNLLHQVLHDSGVLNAFSQIGHFLIAKADAGDLRQ